MTEAISPKEDRARDKKLCKKCNDRETISPNTPYCALCMSEMSKEARKAKKTGQDERKTAKKVEGLAEPKATDKTADRAILVDFEGYHEILQQIESLALEEMRPLNMKIIYMLKKNIQALG